MSRPRVALITGASSGLGRELALELARAGATTIVIAARRTTLLEELARELRAAEVKTWVETMDVGDTERTVARIREIDRDTGGLELVVANAGVGAAAGADPIAWETLRDPFHINFCGAAATLTAALPAMVARGRGQLVGIGSLSAYAALPGSAAYCTPKAGLKMLLDCLRLDLFGTGVATTHVRLGFVRTAMVAHSTHPMPQIVEPADAAREIVRRLARRPREIVLPRALGTATRLLGAMPDPARELMTRALSLAAPSGVAGAAHRKE